MEKRAEEMTSLLFEKAVPYVAALVAALLWWQMDLALPNGTPILSSSLTLGAILSGFLATAKAIVMTLDSPVMQRVRETTYVNDLVSYLGQAIWLSFGFCIVAMVGFFVDTGSPWYGFIWIVVGVASAVAFVRVTSIMFKIIKHPSRDPH